MKPFRQYIHEDYGEVMFAQQRFDVAQPVETNTPKEDEAFAALQAHFMGGRDAALVKELPDLLKAIKSGKHNDILRVPKQHKYAYRLMADMSASSMKSLFGVSIGRSNRGITSGGAYTNKKNIISSWTVDLTALPKIVDDFGGKLYRKNADSFHVLMVADLNNTRDSFLMNPDKYYDMPTMAGQFSYQREIISYKTVKVQKVIFCNKDEFDGNDKLIIQWLMDRVSA